MLYLYQTELHDRWYWHCNLCDAWVGCLDKSKVPMGSLANQKLRNLRQRCHKEFDVVWKSGEISRSRAYSLLAEAMKLPQSKAHIGMFSLEQCTRLLRILGVDK